jgi:hypothetical protein
MDTQSNQQQPAPKDNRILIYSLLAGALLISWGYMFFSNKKATETEEKLTTQNVAVSSELQEVKDLYSETSFRLDSLMGENETMSENLNTKNAEIVKMRSEIAKILSNKNATDAELKKARRMISELNGKVEGLAAEVEKLEGENATLSAENSQVKKAKEEIENDLLATQASKTQTEQELADTKDVASTLKASNINILAINEKSGGKERETTSAKRADKLRVNFTIDDNRLAKSGPKELFVVVSDPTGKIITYGAGDVFIKRDGQSQPYTSRVSVNYEAGKSLPVSYDWKNDKTFTEGKYTIEIFHNGFKIGEQVRTMKKGGLFS